MKLLLFNLATDEKDPYLGFCCRWITEIAAHCESVHIITMRAGTFNLPPNVHVHSVGLERGYSRPRRVFNFYRLLLRLLQENAFDGCFAHMMPLFVALGGPILKLKGVPILLWYAHRSVTGTLRLAHLFSDRVFTSAAGAFRLSGDKLKVVGQGIDLERFSPAPSVVESVEGQQHQVLVVGRISPVKNLETIVLGFEIFSRLQVAANWELVLIGATATHTDKEYASKLIRMVQEAGLKERVHFLGAKSQSELVPLLQAGSCVVSFTESESIDKALLEGMACGLPVISSAERRPIFDELHQGWAINATPAALAEKLKELAEMSAEARKSLGAEMRRTVCRDHDLRGLANRIITELRDLRGRAP
jgi:glycosyltransferase involved in cell wall biosynthesis